jgi:putative spermidine/putrescine transport system ATP-binding protein
VVSGSFLGAHGRVTTALADGRHVVVQVPSSTVAHYPPGTVVRLTPRGDAALAVAAASPSLSDTAGART